jgi:hypothetical protein
MNSLVIVVSTIDSGIVYIMMSIGSRLPSDVDKIILHNFDTY